VDKVELTREEMVAAIRRMMNCGEWRGRRSVVELSDKWGRSESAIRGMSAEASKQIRLLDDEDEVADLQAERARWVATCERVIAEAFARKRQVIVDGVVEEYPNPDLKTAQSTLEMLARAKGIVIAPGPRELLSGLLTDLTGRLSAETRDRVVAELHGQRLERPKLETGIVVELAKKEDGE
jgi:hypothetical protein